MVEVVFGEALSLWSSRRGYEEASQYRILNNNLCLLRVSSYVSSFLFVHGEWAVRGRTLIPNSLVQLTKSVLRKAVPLS